LQTHSTEQMKLLTKEAQREAVNMRVISIMTFFLLPATFVSVRAISLSSEPWTDSSRHFSVQMSSNTRMEMETTTMNLPENLTQHWRCKDGLKWQYLLRWLFWRLLVFCCIGAKSKGGSDCKWAVQAILHHWGMKRRRCRTWGNF